MALCVFVCLHTCFFIDGEGGGFYLSSILTSPPHPFCFGVCVCAGGVVCVVGQQ